MRATDCIARLAAAAGRKLTDDEVAAIFERINKAALDIKAGRKDPAEVTLGAPKGTKQLRADLKGKPANTIIQEAAQRAAAELEREAQLRLRQANLQAMRLGGSVAAWRTLVNSGIKPLEAVRMLVARDFSGRGNVESIEQRVAGRRGDFERKLLPVWESLGDDFAGFFQDKTKLRDLLRELKGEDTGNPLAKRGAQAFHQVAEEARQTFNAHGGDIGRLDDWGFPQHHSQELVAKAGKEAWTDAILPLLDRQRYVDDAGLPMSDQAVREFLGKAWDTIATDGMANIEPGKFTGTGKRANRHAEHRQIHFMDADSVMKYWEQFGDRSAFEILHGHIGTMARDVAFLEKFGPNPDTTFRTLKDIAAKQSAVSDPKKLGAVSRDLNSLDNLWSYASGKTKPSANLAFSGTSDALANLNVAGKLGGAAIASFFGDKALMEAVSHLNDLPVIQRWRTEISLLNPANTADRRLLQQQGLMLDSVRSGMNRFYEDLGKSGVTGKLANAVMRLTGMQAINDIRKGAFGAAMMNAFGEQIAAGTSFSRLAESDIRSLRHMGVDEVDWKVWKLAKPETIGSNTQMLTPDSIARIPDEAIAKSLAADIETKRQSIGSQIADLVGRNSEEAARFNKRLEALKVSEAKAAERLNKFITSTDATVRQAADRLKAQSDLLQAKVEVAEAQADIDAFILQRDARNNVTDLATDLLAGRGKRGGLERMLSESDRRGDAASRKRGMIGEKLGEKRGAAEQRVKNLEQNLSRLEREASAEVNAKFEELKKSMDVKYAEHDAWLESAKERVQKREFVIDRLLGEISIAGSKTVAEARQNAIVKLLGVINTESEFAIVTPGWNERAAFYGSSQRGTVPGEIMRSILQFKSFPWTQFKRGMDAVANQDTPVSKAAMTAYLLGSTALAGAMIMQTREVLAGKDPRKMFEDPKTAGKFWGAAFLQGGALGIYGDFLYSVNETRYGSGPLEAMAGPTLGPLLEMGIVQPLTAAKKSIEGKDTHLMAQTLQDLKGFVPGGNMWYTKAAMDHMVWQQVFESLSPGYLATIRSRTMKDYQQDWWWQPGEMTPDRMPDFGSAVGQ